MSLSQLRDLRTLEVMYSMSVEENAVLMVSYKFYRSQSSSFFEKQPTGRDLSGSK